jgi:UDP-N-acetylmuramoyl-L-alanyl-D-glutamate--2,6-diaminopimelate ligase
VDALRFDVAVFTNLSHDHLDFHGTMEAYWEAKASLFTPERAAVGVVNVDDPWGRRLLDRAAIPVVPVSSERLADVRLARAGSRFEWRGQRIELGLLGRVNVLNALLAAEAALALGIDVGTVAEGLERARPVRGRLETIWPPSGGTGPTVLVDYAHTPDALGEVLAAARTLAGVPVPGRPECNGRVIVVFGCGGDRDRAKRPLMGGVAARLADLAVVTSDNPRHEDPDAIIGEILGGVAATANARLVVEADRGTAIAGALVAATPADVVVLAGKGHETYQQVGDDFVPFDDAEVARRLLAPRHRA